LQKTLRLENANFNNNGKLKKPTNIEAGIAGENKSRRLIIRGRVMGTQFLIDTGADVSTILKKLYTKTAIAGKLKLFVTVQ